MKGDQLSSNEEMFIQAYSDYEQMLLKRSFFKINDNELADDLVQNTFLKTWEYLLRNGKVDHMRAFLYNVLNNFIVDEYRKNKPISLDMMTEDGFQIEFDDSEKIINTIDGKTAMLMIPLLSDKYSEILSMRFIDEMTISEIAKATSKRKPTVRVQIHRGLEKLAILMRVENVEK